MRIILLESIENLGRKGEIVNVKDGYARNYLIPKGFAIKVTESNIKMIQEKQKKLEKEREKEIKTVEDLKNRIESLKLTFYKRAGEEDVLFGSVTSAEIEEKLKEEGIEIDKKKIVIKEPIKKLGEHEVEVKVHPEVRAKLKIEVLKEE